jgi:uncharacterized protein YndB with AHSA1/START domain
VWQAITDPEFTRQYLHGTAFDSPPVAGQPFHTSLADGGAAVDGTVEVCDPPHRLVHTWHTLYDPELAAEPASRVEWEIEPAGEGLTRLRLVHGDLALSPKTWTNVEHGWVWILDGLKTLLETGSPLPPVTSATAPATDPDGEWHRAQGIEANNSTWELIDKAERDGDDEEEMLRRAYAAAYHWARAARRTPANDARGSWLLSKVHLLTGQPQRALHYAERCMDVCRRHGLTDFDLAYAHEATARALKALGRDADAGVEWKAAQQVPVADEEDRKILEADMAVGP